MNSQQSSPAWKNRAAIIRSVSAVVVIALVFVSYRVVFAEPSREESTKVICAMRVTPDTPLFDAEKSNTREQIADAITERARVLSDAADKTGGSIRDALSSYSSAMKDIASAIEDDTDGSSLSSLIADLASNKELSKAEENLRSIIDSQC